MELFETTLSKQRIYSVSELNRETKNLLSQYFSSIQVEGEISNLSTPSSGHIYFSLKDKTAQIRCAMFKTQLRRLKFAPENGMRVIISAQVSLYEARGDYQLIVDKMQESGAGDLQLAFERLKTKLLNEGLFESELKQQPPQIPNKIGVITSPSGAAIHDILTVLKHRFPAIPVIIYPTAVQGETAKFDICKAIASANHDPQVDVIILARGGGSLEDLWAFNEECVARAIANSAIPIISGIGHEVDFTIADFVADLRAPTPSAAAEHAAPSQQLLLNRFQTIERQLQQSIMRSLTQYRKSVSWLQKRLQQQHPGQQLIRHAQGLDNMEMRLRHAIEKKIELHKKQLAQQRNILQQHNPANKIAHYQQQQRYLTNRLHAAMRYKLESLQKKYLATVHTLQAVSPLATLARGYAIVSLPGSTTIVSSTEQLDINDNIRTRLAHGEVISQIKEINHE